MTHYVFSSYPFLTCENNSIIYSISEGVISWIFFFYSSTDYFLLFHSSFFFTWVHTKYESTIWNKQTKNLKYVEYNPKYCISMEKDRQAYIWTQKKRYISLWELQKYPRRQGGWGEFVALDGKLEYTKDDQESQHKGSLEIIRKMMGFFQR